MGVSARRSYRAAGTFSLSLSHLDIEKPWDNIHSFRCTNSIVTGLWVLAFVQSPAQTLALCSRPCASGPAWAKPLEECRYRSLIVATGSCPATLLLPPPIRLASEFFGSDSFDATTLM